jgi:hypothetical protein
MRPSHPCLAIILSLAVTASRGSAAGEPGAAEFEEGMQLYRQRDCKGALAPLEVASRAAPRPNALLALGFCYRQLKQFSKATNAYQHYLRLRSDDEKHALSLLEATMEEEREWRRAHPEPAPPPKMAHDDLPAFAPPAAPKPEPLAPTVRSETPTTVPVAALPGAENKPEPKTHWPLWVAGGAVLLAGGIVIAILLKPSSRTEPSATFNGH